MMLRTRRLTFLLAALVIVVMACTDGQEPGVPPCMPLEGEAGDPCEGDSSIAMAQFDSAYSNTHVSRFFGDKPLPLRWYLEGGFGALFEGHIVVRGQFLPNTVRCTQHWGYRPRAYLTTTVRNTWVLTCYADIRAVEYVVGSGPPTLTAVVARAIRGRLPTDPEAERAEAERLLAQANLELTEGIFFLGPSVETSVESWEVFAIWDLERRDDGTVIAVHPDRSYWQRQENYETAYRSRAEFTLSAFRTAAQAAHSSMLRAHGGRIDQAADLPQLVTNVNNLRTYYEAVGAYDDGHTPAQPPPACAKAVPDYTNNPGLVQDCVALLSVKDTLRGTGTLNWSLATAIGRWDGVTVGGTPTRVTSLKLEDKGLTGSIPSSLGGLSKLTVLSLNRNQLTGSIPAELGNLSKLEELALSRNRLTGSIPETLTKLKQLGYLYLSGNTLTGCVPAGLRGVDNHDLASLRLPDCA